MQAPATQSARPRPFDDARTLPRLRSEVPEEESATEREVEENIAVRRATWCGGVLAAGWVGGMTAEAKAGVGVSTVVMPRLRNSSRQARLQAARPRSRVGANPDASRTTHTAKLSVDACAVWKLRSDSARVRRRGDVEEVEGWCAT